MTVAKRENTDPRETRVVDRRRRACSNRHHEPAEACGVVLQHLNFAALLDTGTTVYLKSSDSAILELVKADSVPARPQICDAGLRHIAFAVDDLGIEIG